jgi:hypothetical protein
VTVTAQIHLQTDWLVLGSWIARVFAEEPRYAKFLCDHFRQETVAPPASAGRAHDAEIRLIHAAPGDPAFVGNSNLPEDRLQVSSPSRDRLLLASPLLRASVSRAGDRVVIEIRLAGMGVPDPVLNVHFTVAIRRILLWLGLLYLHAGAVVRNGRASIFVGEKGAGKTTTCLRLAKEGAVLLSEDHVLVKRASTGILVSGADRLARVLPDAEAHVFDRTLPAESRDFAGVLKKEFHVGEHFRCSHFSDYLLERIFFLRVGEAFAIRPISETEGTLRLMTGSRSGFRFSSAGEYQSYLDFFAALTAGKQVYDVTLSRNLGDLSYLVQVLHRG